MNEICPYLSCELCYHDLNHRYGSKQCSVIENRISSTKLMLNNHKICMSPTDPNMFKKSLVATFLPVDYITMPTIVSLSIVVVSTKMDLGCRPGEHA